MKRICSREGLSTMLDHGILNVHILFWIGFLHVHYFKTTLVSIESVLTLFHHTIFSVGPLFSNDQLLVASKFDLYGAIEKAGSCTVYLTKFSWKRGKIPFQPIPLRVTSLFQPSHCIQPFLVLLVPARISASVRVTPTVSSQGEPTKLGSKNHFAVWFCSSFRTCCKKPKSSSTLSNSDDRPPVLCPEVHRVSLQSFLLLCTSTRSRIGRNGQQRQRGR